MGKVADNLPFTQSIISERLVENKLRFGVLIIPQKERGCQGAEEIDFIKSFIPFRIFFGIIKEKERETYAG